MPSPMGGYFASGMDSGTEASRQIAYFQQYGRMPYPMHSPSGANSYKRVIKSDKKEIEQSPKVELMNNIFQTPTSRGLLNQRFGDTSKNKDDAGSFGASPIDISTTKAVFNQQTKFQNLNKEYEIPIAQKQGNKDVMTPSGNYFSASPYVFTNNYQSSFVPNYGNTPTGGSFGASPVCYFNMPSPHTGMAVNNMTPFNQASAFEQRDGSSYGHSSPKFNSIPEHLKMPQNIMSGQDSARQYNANFSGGFNKMNNMNQNYASSPANAFSFSCKSGMF